MFWIGHCQQYVNWSDVFMSEAKPRQKIYPGAPQLNPIIDENRLLTLVLMHLRGIIDYL